MPTQYFMKYFQFYCYAVDEPPILLATFQNFLWLHIKKIEIELYFFSSKNRRFYDYSHGD